MTALRVLRRQPVSISFLPTVIGIDDWAKRRGQSYGTIIVDLERHRVIDLLPDREPSTVAAWLREHPSIRIVARDRSAQYAQGIQAGNPQAIQVADRWHLLKNLSEVVERTLRDVLPKLRAQVSQTPQKPPKRAVFPRARADTQRKTMTREQRLRRYELVKRLQQRGCSTRQIARISGLSRGTILRYCQADTFPERRSKLRSSMLDPYLPYLEQRVAEGCNNAQQLWRELRTRGYPGSARQVSKWMQQHRQEKSGTRPTALDKPNDSNVIALPSLRTCCYLITADPEHLKPSDHANLVSFERSNYWINSRHSYRNSRIW